MWGCAGGIVIFTKMPEVVYLGTFSTFLLTLRNLRVHNREREQIFWDILYARFKLKIPNP